MKSIFAISWFVCPSASRRSTSRSRSESGSSSARRRSSASAATSRAPSDGWTYRSPAATARIAADDLGVGRLLEHVAARAGLERLADVARVVLHREHEHLRVGHGLQERGHALDPALAGHDDVHQHDVGLVLDRLEDGALRVRRPRRPSRCPAPRRARGEGRSGRRRGRRRRGRGSSRSGTSATSVVPAPAPDSIRSRPPTSATRSRMPTSPSASSRVAAGSKPAPVVLDHRRTRAVPRARARC